MQSKPVERRAEVQQDSTMDNLTLQVVVDKKNNRVVFVESGKDFVDILFSFLTLPMGSIVRILGEQSGVRCMDNLYESVENLDTKYMQTDACKAMLLQPRSASEVRCEFLAVKVDDLNPRRKYRCPKWECFIRTHHLYSDVPSVRCACGLPMIKVFELNKRMGPDGVIDEDGVFVRGGGCFMITEGLNVMPISTAASLSLFQSLGIKNADALEKRTVHVSRSKILRLLKRMLLSKTPLADVFLRKGESFDHNSEAEEFELIGTSPSKVKKQETKELIHVRLLESKSTNKLVYAEAGEDFVDVLFSFLTFPLGSIVKLLNKCSSLGCVDNLYQSVEALSIHGSGYIKSQECKNMLLDPKLSSYFNCSNQLLNVDENMTRTLRSRSCFDCFEEARNINPKLQSQGTNQGGGFAKRSIKFIVTDEMLVTPVSPTFGIDALKYLQVPITSLVERDVACSETEVLNLLKACLLSSAALSEVFNSKK